MAPRAAALPTSETLSGPKYSGKMVTMSMRMQSCLDGFAGVEQPGWRVDDQPSAGSVDIGPDCAHERDQGLVPGTAPHDQQVLAVVQHVSDLADRVAGGGDHAEPDELVVVELVRVVRGRNLGRVHHQQGAAQ